MTREEKFLARRESNNEILKILTEYVEKYPEQRFGQILYNFGFLPYGDPFYEESVDTLERVHSTKSHS